VAIVNWLVQGCIVAALTAAVLHFLKNARAQSRYAFCSSALTIVLALPLVTLLVTSVATTSGGAPGVAMAGPLISVPHDEWNLAVALTVLCGVWSSLCGLQFLIALSALHRTRRSCRAFPSALESSLHYWTNVKARGRGARLMLSDDVRTAAVLSGPIPIIAVAPSVLNHLTAEEVDRLVIHEWAHVQRRDDAAHLVQIICRIVAGWHPAVSWLNRRLHEERESACDEMVVALMDSPKRYAASLLKLAALPRMPVKPLPAVGALSSSELAVRVQRIVSGRQCHSHRWSTNAVAAGTVLLAVVSSILAAVRVVEATAASDASVRSVVLSDDQRLMPTRVESQPVAETPRRAEPSQVSPVRQSATYQNLVRSDQAPDRQPLAHKGAAMTKQAEGSRDNSAPSPLLRVPLPSMVAPISLEPLPIVQSGGLSQSRDAAQPAALDTGSVPPWTAAANAGRAVGQGSKNAGVATAGFFTRVSKRIASSF